ncbi:type II toxin-antitoxin system VapC family toxin [Methylocapsa sp. S129]|uniref:type II toxin-antitoxin system VapC family toxin n=1 Tax=Methylocapsa sp. S129 TaxID=1641869 RepID=UPI00131BFEBE|nr:type II toxin-antitoxin system VapC family toxin [Methylocapsa sp. S129]
MRVFDTSAWIEKFIGSALGLRLDAELPDAAQCIVPTIVQLELAKWLARERSEDVADLAIAYTLTCVVVPLDTALAFSAAELCKRHKLSTADAIVYATALAGQAALVTCDAHFEDLPGVLYFARENRA